MTIDDDVKRIAEGFNLDPSLIQAVVNAEGGGDHIIRAVQCSIPSVTTREEAIRITCRSAVHRMRDFIVENGHRGAFVAYWAKKWAPRGAENDPHDQNANWPANVLSGWRNA